MNSSKPSTPVSSPKAQKALSIVVQEPRPQPTTPPPPAQKRQTTFSSRQTKRLSSSFLNTPEPQQQLSQQLSQLSVSGVRDKELNLDSQIPSLPYTPSSKRRSYGIFESPVGRSPYGVALRTPRNEDHDSPEQRLKRYGIVGRDNDGDDDDDNEYEDEETRHNYTPMGSVGDDEDEESRRLKLQKTPQFHSAKRLYDTLNSVMINNQNSAHNRYMNGIINSGNGQSINESTTNDSGSNIINKSPNLKTNRHSWSANVNLQFSPSKAPLPPPPQYQQHKLPPPPPPPATFFDDTEKDSENPSPASGGINAVFAELNQGANITSGLKKVDKSEMTHKNPELRKQPPVAPKKPAPPKKPSSLSGGVSSAPVKKPAKKELIDGTKWIIQNFTKADISDLSPITIEVEMHQSVFIGNCSDVTIQLKGKANAVSVSETKNVALVIDSLISGVDVIKSYKFGIQVLGLVPMLSIDKSDEGTIYLSQESIDNDSQVFTSSTTALNINAPKENDDYEELAVPEQFVSKVVNGKLVTQIVEHAG